MRRHEGGTGSAPAGVVRSCTPGRTPEQSRRLLPGRLGSGHRGTRKREKPVARWTGAFLLLASCSGAPHPLMGEREKRRADPKPDQSWGRRSSRCLQQRMHDFGSTFSPFAPASGAQGPNSLTERLGPRLRGGERRER